MIEGDSVGLWTDSGGLGDIVEDWGEIVEEGRNIKGLERLWGLCEYNGG